jgi:hypothetical protein
MAKQRRQHREKKDSVGCIYTRRGSSAGRKDVVEARVRRRGKGSPSRQGFAVEARVRRRGNKECHYGSGGAVEAVGVQERALTQPLAAVDGAVDRKQRETEILHQKSL